MLDKTMWFQMQTSGTHSAKAIFNMFRKTSDSRINRTLTYFAVTNQKSTRDYTRTWSFKENMNPGYASCDTAPSLSVQTALNISVELCESCALDK